jgi:hypothetical protein
MTTATARSRAPSNGGTGKTGGAAVLFDLDAYEAEATRAPFTFTLGGKDFEMPHMGTLDWHHGLDGDGNPIGLTIHETMRLGLGDQWEKFDKLKLSSAGYNELWRRWSKHSSDDPGKDEASPDSSGDTAGQ